MDSLDFFRRLADSNVKIQKRATRIILGLFITNFILLLSHIFILFNKENIFSYTSIGCLSINCFWLLLFFCESWTDLGNEKHLLRMLRQHENMVG